MANYSIKTDLLKVKGAFVTNIKGKTATKRCLCIPIDDSGLFLGKQGCYLNMTAIEMQNPQFSDTHCIKVSFDKEVYEKMTEEEKRHSQSSVGFIRWSVNRSRCLSQAMRPPKTTTCRSKQRSSEQETQTGQGFTTLPCLKPIYNPTKSRSL